MKRIRTILAKIFSLLLLFGIGQIGISNAYFSDTATVTGNTVTAGYWEEEESEPSQVVVINEVMWMGSTSSSADEWIELRNTTANPVDLTGWKIENAGESGASITLNGIIPAGGFFFLSNYVSNASAISNAITADQVTTSLSLLDGAGEQLTLKDSSNVIIDQTPVSWPAGIDTTEKKSMERNNDPTTGWHTCINVACNDTTYWDAEGNNYGTPKAANLSENDSSLNPQEEGQEQGAEQASQDEEDDEIAEEEVEEVVEEDIEDSSQPADPEPEDDSQESVLPEEPEVEQEAPTLQEDLEVPPSPEPPAQPAPPEEIINEQLP